MPNLEISASILNLPPAIILGGSAAGIQRGLNAAGYEYAQYMPVRNLIHARAAELLVRRGVVASFHQSWFRTGNHPSVKDRLMGRIFPHVQESMEPIADLEVAAPEGRLLPVVVHPNEQYLGHLPSSASIDYGELRQTGRFGPFLHQPTGEVLDAWGILSWSGDKTASRLLDEQHTRGFDGVALDLHHLSTERGGEDTIKLGIDWLEEFAGKLAAAGALAAPSEVQVSFRPDFGGNKLDLANYLNGHPQATPHGRMLTVISEELPADQAELRMTTEVPASAWKLVGTNWREGNRELLEAIWSGPLGG